MRRPQARSSHRCVPLRPPAGASHAVALGGLAVLRVLVALVALAGLVGLGSPNPAEGWSGVELGADLPGADQAVWVAAGPTARRSLAGRWRLRRAACGPRVARTPGRRTASVPVAARLPTPSLRTRPPFRRGPPAAA